MNKRDLETHIESLYLKSLNFDNNITNSPVLAVDSIKSLIGINLDMNYSQLIDWLESYLNGFEKKYNFKKYSFEKVPEVISYKKLDNALFNKDLNSIKENIYYLSRVSEGSHIFEYLLEYSLKHCGDIHGMIWSAYRMDRFLHKKHVLINLEFCCQLIINNIEESNSNQNTDLDWKDILKYESLDIIKILNYYTIFNSNLIRKDNIKSHLGNKMLKVGYLKTENSLQSEILNSQVSKGRAWILEHLLSIKLSDIDYDLINLLNSFRAALMVAHDDEKKLIWKQLNNQICS